MSDKAADVSQTSSTVTVFLRLRPVPKKSQHVHIEKSDGTICFEIPRDEAAGLINNQREKYSFLFNGILTDDSSQEEVFERVCHASLMDFMSGINTTVFAYGQTGSGKTFTITGGPERYADRGLIPRSIAKVFDCMTQDSQQLYTLHISYMEIYNHTAFDLLDPSREIKELSDLPPVTILEDDEGQYHMRGLSLNRADTAEEALNLLFLGDTNRMIAETPMNMASSRSHCVFTMHLEARRPGESVVRRSKFHLVDLAGSERVGRTGINGTILTEAKYINASLHFLEQVIIALQERSMGIPRSHIPYRNSLMTMVLRDSLGGNCKTSMIANISTAQAYIDESISTCRFAQRVAMVSNTATVNEETDPALVIKALKQQVRELKDQVKLLQGGEEVRGPITDSERESLAKQVQEYVSDPSPEASLDLGASMLFINAAFLVFKDMCRNTSSSGLSPGSQTGLVASSSSSIAKNISLSSRSGRSGGTGSENRGGSGDVPPNKGVQALQEENAKLKLQVQQRDNELSILVSMLKKREAVIQAAANSAAVPGNAEGTKTSEHGSASGDNAGGSHSAQSREEGGTTESQNTQAVLFDMNSLADRHRAFELFRKSYRRNEAIEKSKMELKGHYVTAKTLAAEASSVKDQVQALKAELEQRRLRRSAADIAAGGDGTNMTRDPSRDAELAEELAEDARIAEDIKAKTAQYKKSFDGLRESKHVIEELQARLENSRNQMAKDFVNWYQKMAQLFPGGQPTGEAAALATSVKIGSRIAHSSNSISEDPNTATLRGTASSASVSSSTGSTGGLRRPPPLPSVPEHGLAAPDGSNSTQVLALARSAAQMSVSDAAQPAPAGVGNAPQSTPNSTPQAQLPGSRTTGGSLSDASRRDGSWKASGGLGRTHAPETDAFGDRTHAVEQPITEGSSKAVAVGGGNMGNYPPAVVEAAKNFLTGDPSADEDILGFYMARHSMMQGGG